MKITRRELIQSSLALTAGVSLPGFLRAGTLSIPREIKDSDGIRKGKLIEPNNSVNTATTIAYLFGIDTIPLSWTGEVPMSIFETSK